MNKLFRHTVGIVCELLTLKDPYVKYQRPKLLVEKKDSCGRVVRQVIRASNHADATRHLKGVSARLITATRIAPRTWDIRLED